MRGPPPGFRQGSACSVRDGTPRRRHLFFAFTLHPSFFFVGIVVIHPPKQRNILRLYREICGELIKFGSNDDLVFEYVACVACAVHLTKGQEGVWGYLTGPPSGGKTETLKLIMDWKEQVVTADDFTRNSMVSAYDATGKRIAAIQKGKKDPYDPSLLPKLHKKVLVIKDLTGLLVREEACDSLMGVLRCAYDQGFTKFSGTLGKQDIRSEFGILAAVTDDGTDRLMDRDVTLGERFINLRCQQGNTTREEDVELGLHVLKMREKGKARKRRELARACRDLLSAGINQVKLGPCSASHPKMGVRHRWLVRATSLIAKLRTQPGELAVVSHERNPRLLQVMSGLMDTYARLSGLSYWPKRALRMTRRILWDSLPVRNLMLVEYLLACEIAGKARNGVEIHTMARMIGFETWKIHKQIDQYRHTGIIRSVRRGSVRLSRWVHEELLSLGIPINEPEVIHKIRRLGGS